MSRICILIFLFVFTLTVSSNSFSKDNSSALDNHYFGGCLVIPKEENHTEKINEIMKKNKYPIIIGKRDNPKRNITNTIFDIKMRAK
mgnify:CR=1 FL=1